MSANSNGKQTAAPVYTAPPVKADGVFPFNIDRVRELVEALKVPFDSSRIEWR